MTLFKKPILDLCDVERALRSHEFAPKTRVGTQQLWEGNFNGSRRLVTVEEADAPFSDSSRVLAAIIRASGIPRRLFFREAGKPLPWGVV